MSVDNSFIDRLASRSIRDATSAADELLRNGDGGGTSGGMEERVTRLEVQMENVQRDLGEIKADLRSTLDIVRSLPTRSDLNTFRWQWVATSVAAIALIVGGIIGGLSWLQPSPAPVTAASVPPPVIIQVPQPVPQQPVPAR